MSLHFTVDLVVYSLSLTSMFMSGLLYYRNRRLREHLFNRATQDAELAHLFKYAPMQEIIKKRRELENS